MKFSHFQPKPYHVRGAYCDLCARRVMVLYALRESRRRRRERARRTLKVVERGEGRGAEGVPAAAMHLVQPE